MWALANDPVARPPSAQAFALYLARAAAEAYGAGWLARSGLVLHLDDDVRAAAERPSVSAPPPLPSITKSDTPSPASDTAPSPSADDAPADGLLSQSVPSATQTGDRPTGRVRRVRPHHRSAVPPAHRRPGGVPRHRGASRCRIAVIAFLLAGAVALVAATRSGDPSDISIRPLSPPLTGHTHWVLSVLFSPNQRVLASSSRDGTVRLWDVTDRSRPRLFGAPLAGHTMFVFSVAFSPDGHVLASGSYDGTIRLWDVTNRSDPHPVGDHLWVSSTTVRSVAFSPDGRTLASGSFDGTVRLWNVTDLSSPYPRNDSLTVHGDWVMSVAFSADGRTLATGSNDKTVRLWELRQPASAGS
ncbi:WD40 repeat domain-containing protein [Protofrankia coriariae]